MTLRSTRTTRPIVSASDAAHRCNLSLDVASVLRNALAEIDRDEQLDDDRDIIRRYASEIIPRAKTWRSLPGPERRRRARCDDIVRDAMTAVDDSVAVTGSGQRAER